MPVEMYSENEALQRIYSCLIGTNPVDYQGYMGEMPKNEALSRIAQLLEGSLPDIVFAPVSVMDDEFGGIFTWTGTTVMTGITAAFTKITGAFHNSMVDSANVTGQPTSDRIYVNKYGTYFVSWQLSFQGSPDLDYTVEPYTSSVGVPQAAAMVRPSASGSAISMSGSGYLHTSGTSTYVSLYVKPSGVGWFKLVTGQISVRQVSST